MATVSKWTPFDVALDITATGSSVTRISATQFTVKIAASWETYYSGAKTNYGMTASSGGGSVNLNTFGTKASSGSGSFTGTYSISGNGSATKTITVTFKNYNTDNNKSATKTVSFSVTVPAWTSYTVSYNANGGSGAPSSQTKWKDQTLTLSSTKPTRTGYTFQGWGTSSSATTVSYKAGASYSSNAAITLYAVWKANTYTVSYNANGGSGAPSSQTKTYGKNLTLSSIIPIRSKYTFQGWGTSASATTVSYKAGATYTKNEAITLYAIWESAYSNPTIKNLSAKRCDMSGSVSDTGRFMLINFEWATYQDVKSVRVSWTIDGVEDSEVITATGTSGIVTNQIMGQNSGQGSSIGKFDPDISYDIVVTVSDNGGSTTKIVKLSTQEFPIDILAEGKGIAFGKAAELDGVADFKYEQRLRENAVFLNDKAVFGTSSDGSTEYSALIPVTASGNTTLGYGLYSAKTGSTNIYGNEVNFYTKTGNICSNGNNFIFNTKQGIYGINPNDGELYEAFCPQNINGNVVIGWDNYDNKNGSTNIYGYDILHGVSNIASPGTYRPYFRKGDTVAVVLHTAGFVTNSLKEIHFTVPLTKPIVGSPTVTVTSNDGFIIRQNNSYTHGSSASAYVTPTKYTAYAYHGVGVRICATFDTTTNAVNNSPCGIMWRGNVVFS